MNRAQRRAAQRAGITDAALTYAEAYQCPDCLAETELDVLGDRVWWLRVYHDPTCPTYRAMEARHA